MGFRAFVPVVAACPGCGRTTSTVFQELARRIEDDLADAMPVWREKYPGVEALKVAVMGCIVNGPGESKHADIGISLPGTGEQPAAPVFIDGKKAATLRGPTLADDFRALVNDYVERRFGATGAGQTRRSSASHPTRLLNELDIMSARQATGPRVPRPTRHDGGALPRRRASSASIPCASVPAHRAARLCASQRRTVLEVQASPASNCHSPWEVGTCPE